MYVFKSKIENLRYSILIKKKLYIRERYEYTLSYEYELNLDQRPSITIHLLELKA